MFRRISRHSDECSPWHTHVVSDRCECPEVRLRARTPRTLEAAEEAEAHQLLTSWGSGVRRRKVDDVAGSEERDTDVRRRSAASPNRGAECRDTDCRAYGSACCWGCCCWLGCGGNANGSLPLSRGWAHCSSCCCCCCCCCCCRCCCSRSCCCCKH